MARKEGQANKLAMATHAQLSRTLPIPPIPSSTLHTRERMKVENHPKETQQKRTSCCNAASSGEINSVFPVISSVWISRCECDSFEVIARFLPSAYPDERSGGCDVMTVADRPDLNIIQNKYLYQDFPIGVSCSREMKPSSAEFG